jgi:hypothetical protein
LAIIELPAPVDSTFRHHASGIVLEVVSEVDEMGLFHQLGYEDREHEWPQSTIALLSGLQEMRLWGLALNMGCSLQQ